jgi:hypothetical protein
MEITNNSRYYSIPLVVGRRIAQIVFFDTFDILDRSYEAGGKYQTTANVEDMMKSWDPSAMLPQMFKDREITNGTNEQSILALLPFELDVDKVELVHSSGHVKSTHMQNNLQQIK